MITFGLVPTRPPAEESVHSPDEVVIHRSYQILGKQINRVEYLIGYVGNAFASTGNIENNLLSNTSIHPMRDNAVKELSLNTGNNWSTVHKLIKQGTIIGFNYDGWKFYARRFTKRKES